MPDNLRHAQYTNTGMQIDAPQFLLPSAQDSAGTVFVDAPGYVTAVRPLNKFNAAKLRSNSNPARVLFYGESSITGQGSGSGAQGLIGAYNTGWPYLIATALGWQKNSIFGTNNVEAGSITLPQYNPKVNYNGKWQGDIGPSGPGGRFIVSSANTQTSGVVFTPGEVFNYIRIWFPVTASLSTSVQVKVDGILVGSYSNAGADAYSFVEFNLQSAVHTIEIINAGAAQAFIAAVEIQDRRTNVPVALFAGSCSATISDLNSAVQAFNWINAAQLLAPDLTFIDCTVNDSNAGTSRASYFAAIESIAGRLLGTSDIVFLTSFASNNANTYNGVLDGIAQAISDLASDIGASVIDCRSLFGHSYTRANSRGIAFNSDHANGIGHFAKAALVRRMLTL